jgi:hypothetical protein
MKNLILTLILMCAALITVPAQKQSVTVEIMQGTWIIQGGGENKTPRWFLEWTFENGKFSLSGYPKVQQEGNYRILKNKDGKLTLELFNQKGDWGTKNSQLEIVVDHNNDQLTLIKDKGPFKRVIKKQSSY